MFHGREKPKGESGTGLEAVDGRDLVDAGAHGPDEFLRLAVKGSSTGAIPA
jgi:hypothetical protein